jgi:aspartyl/asparaginyl-tRNA synthetase
LAIFRIGRRYDSIGFRPTGNKRAVSTSAAVTETESGRSASALCGKLRARERQVVTGFRAENSNTSRHLAEFWMIEPEIAFADLSDNAALAEALLNERQEDLAFFDQRIEKGLVAKLERIVGSEFAHMDYGEAIEVLERSNEKFEFPVQWGVDLQSGHERYLTEKHAKKPVIVMNYPRPSKPSTCG